MKRTFTAEEKEFVFDQWKDGIGFSDMRKYWTPSREQYLQS